jgi:NAD(P)-dependent dehydrogenase (short-subunit alcohol dehydrogenase family)
MPTQKYNKLAGKRVLVIGGSSGSYSHPHFYMCSFWQIQGIGFAVAEASLESGASVTISSSSSSRVESAVEALRKSYPEGKVAGYSCDLSKPTLEQDIEALFKQTGKVDHIVFTAGDRLATIPLQEITLESIQRAGQIRFIAPLLLAKVGSRYLSMYCKLARLVGVQYLQC